MANKWHFINEEVVNRDVSEISNADVIERQAKLQADLERSYLSMYKKRERGETLKDEELALRIQRASQNDNSQTRTAEAIEEAKRQERINQKLERLSYRGGQSEEEFQEELQDFGSKYRKIISEA